MKKILIVVSLIAITFLSACQSETDNHLETFVKEYDQYTEIVDFTREGTMDLKFAVLTKGEEVTYLYYLEGVDRDREIVIFVGDTIVHEAFIVQDYLEGDTFYGTFTASELNITQPTEALFKLVSPGSHMSDSVGVDFKQEFMIIDSIYDTRELDRVFVDTEDFVDTDVTLYSYDYTYQQIRFTMILSVIIGIVVYVLSLVFYKKKYNQIVNFKLQNPNDTKYKKWPDLKAFRVLSLLIIIVLWFVVNIITSSIYNTQYEQKTGYNADTIMYEEVVSDFVNLDLGYTQRHPDFNGRRLEYDYVAFVHKNSSHNIIGDLEVTLIGEHEMKGYVYSWSHGGYKYELNYTYISNIEFQVSVYEWTDSNGELEYVEVFKRIFFKKR